MTLVTGGTGFIGTVLIQQLLASGRSVRAIKRDQSIIPKQLQNLPGLTWINADIRDFFTLHTAFEGISDVYHCAALVSYEPKDYRKLMKTNIEGTAHIVNLCLENNVRLLHVSSVAALGDPDKEEMVSENTQWEWNKKKSGYSISKYEAEREVWRGIAEGLDAIIVNPSVVIGASIDKPKSGQIFDSIAKGLNFYPTGSIGIVDVEDVVKIMIELMGRSDISGDNFILNAENISYRDLFTKYSTLLGIKPPDATANRWMLSIAWRIQYLLKKTGINNSGFTKEVARASLKENKYTNQKIIGTLDISFTPLDKSLKKIYTLSLENE